MSDTLEPTLALTPRGHLRLEKATASGPPELPPPLPSRSGGGCLSLPAERVAALRAAFAAGPGHGLFHLGVMEPSTPGLAPALGFWRDLGRLFVARFCAVPDLEEHRRNLQVLCPAAELAALLDAAPPMVGGEYLSAEVLASLWQETEAACREQLAGFEGSVQQFMAARNPAWSLAGRVHFHLAERKDDAARPFAFLATYTTRPGRDRRVRHVPLGQALKEYAGESNRAALLALLGPVQRAAERSQFIRKLVDSGGIYHPLAWSPREAHAFLHELGHCDEAGIAVKVPDWWRARSPVRPQVRVTVGGRPPSSLGLDAMLDFQVDVALEGEPLTREELKRILASTESLVLVKGKWVELDRDKLQEVLDHWKSAESGARGTGLSFLEAMRLLSGAGLAAGAEGDEVAGEESASWSERVAGPWLAEALEALRHPVPAERLDPGSELRAELRPYQRAGVAWLWQLDRLRLGGCLADDMGLGKTIQVITLMLLLAREEGRGPHLLIVPASLLANWTAELDKFAPRLRYLVAHPSAHPAGGVGKLSAASVRGLHLVLTSYSYLARLSWARSVKWDLVVLDEAQAIKNAGARQSREVKTVPARVRLALTGTPVENRLSDLWSIFDFVNPGLLGNAREFGRFAKQLGERHSEQYAPLRRLIRPYVLRRLKTDRSIIADLPEKTEVLAHCGLTKTQAVLYQKSVADLEGKLEELEGIERRGVVLAFLTRFKQICNHPSQWLGDGSYRPEESGKFARLRELAEQLADRQEKALIFTQYREMTAPLADFLAGVWGRPGLVLHGETEVKKRRALVERFQQDESVPFFVLSLKAGGTGLNLTAASHVIHFDRWWNPAVEDQATDRAFRIGQRKNVLVHKFVCRGTIEERVEKLIASKRQMSQELLSGGAEAALTELSNAQLMELVTLDLESALEQTESSSNV